MDKLREETLSNLLDEINTVKDWCIKKIKNLPLRDLDDPTMKSIDWIHDACHTLMLPQGGRGPIESMSEKRESNKRAEAAKLMEF